MALAATFYFSRLPQRPVLLAHLRFFQHCLGWLLALGPVLNRQFATFALIRIAANRALPPPGFHLKVLEASPDCRIRSLMLMAALPLIFQSFSALSSYCPYSNDTPCVFSLPADVPCRTVSIHLCPSKLLNVSVACHSQNAADRFTATP